MSALRGIEDTLPFLLAQEEELDKREMEGEMSHMLDAPTSMAREYIVFNDIHTLCTFLASPLQMVDYDSRPLRSLIWPTSPAIEVAGIPTHVHVHVSIPCVLRRGVR